MDTPKIFESEFRFCQILWDHEPVSSTELVRLCRERLGWKKSTTYTVIKRQVQHSESRELVDRAFGGSLPQFIAAFAGGRPLNREEAEEIRRLIDQYEEV